MKLDVYNVAREKVGEIEVADEVFGAAIKPHLHHEVVRYQLAKRRRGTHAVLTRHFVNGSTKKVYRQKGTGNARHGSRKPHVYVGGGVVHGPQPRDYSFSVPRKVRRGALRSALSEKVAANALTVIREISMERPRTKDAVQLLGRFGVERALVVDVDNPTLSLSLRNLPKSKFLPTAGLNVYDVLKHDNIVVTEAGLRAIEGALKG